MIKTAVIAALERELRPWVNGWPSVTLDFQGRTLRCYQRGEIVAAAGGIGSARAEMAARAVVNKFRPQTLISAGVAGALIRSLKVGSVIRPNVIVDALTGSEYRFTAGGEIVGGGILVSADAIAESPHAKSSLVEQFHALAVDMEAAGVARVALRAQIDFRCVKAISDEADFKMPPLSRFVDAEGNFATGRFVSWLSIRPQYWARTIALANNTKRATAALCDWLDKNLPAAKFNDQSKMAESEKLAI